MFQYNISNIQISRFQNYKTNLLFTQINPIDYIYGALDCSVWPIEPFQGLQNIELVDKDSSIANMIMQYVYNTADADVRIDEIYRVNIGAEKVNIILDEIVQGKNIVLSK